MADLCRSCGAPVRWVKTEHAKAMPLDEEPTSDGNIVIEQGIARVVGPLFADGRPLHKSHFATCPNAAQHRKGR